MLYTLPQIIENSARLFPERESFRCGKVALSYSELNERTDKLAKYLVDSGVSKGDRIGIYMDRCLETVIAVYGIMKAGAAYVPLDSLAPHSRTSYLLNNCGIEHLITTKKQTKRITALLRAETNLKSVVGIPSELATLSVSWETIFDIELTSYTPIKILESDLAYIMYTSGSTGAPKGIMHTHHSGLTYAKLSSSLYDLSFKDRVANHAPLHFDISTFGYFSAPLASATTVIIPDAYTKLPASLSDLMEKEKITVWYSVPLALIQLLLNGVLDKRDLSKLRWVLYGGENFIPKYLKSLMELWPHATFSNVYGPAEINQCTYYNLTTPPADDSQIPLGKIWDNSDYKIVDDTNKEVSKGQTGELIVRTATMMTGYWNNIALTEKSIYTEQIAIGVENRYYRTGDLVREDENGNLFFLGRNDRQIKIRGYRVELDEVEAVVSRHEKVKEAAVFIMVNENEEKEIAAAVIGISKTADTSLELLSFCKSHLPPYAVPSNIYVLTDFPRTSSGKIKRSEIQKKLIS